MDDTQNPVQGNGDDQPTTPGMPEPTEPEQPTESPSMPEEPSQPEDQGGDNPPVQG